MPQWFQLPAIHSNIQLALPVKYYTTMQRYQNGNALAGLYFFSLYETHSIKSISFDPLGFAGGWNGKCWQPSGDRPSNQHLSCTAQHLVGHPNMTRHGCFMLFPAIPCT